MRTRMRTKNVLLAAGIVVALVAAILITPTAFAQGPRSANAPFGGPFGAGPRGAYPFGERGDSSIVAIAADVLGMDRFELLDELQGGKTIADVAEEQGVEVESIIEAVMADRESRVAAAVDAGQLTQEEADARLETIRARVTERITAEWEGPVGPVRRDGPRRWRHSAGVSLIDVTAEQLDMNRFDIIDALRDGSTIADLAEERGVSTDTIVDAALAEWQPWLDDAVEAGRLTQEQADTRLETMRERLTDKINGEWHPRLGRPGFRGFGGP